MRALTLGAAAVLTAGLLWVLLRYVSLGEVWRAARALPLPTVFAAGALYLAAYVLKAIRFSALLGRRLSWTALLPATLVHHMLNNLLPARLGEVSFPLLLRKRVRILHSAAVLLASRVLDVLAIGAIFLFALVLTRARMTSLYGWLAAFLGALALAALLLLAAPQAMVGLVAPLLRPLRRWRAGRALWAGLQDFPAYVRGMRANLALAAFTSLGFWLANYVMTALVVLALGWTLPLPLIWLGATASVLTTLLPVQGLAGLGTTEGAWTAAFVALGVSASQAALGGFVLHGLQIVFFVGWGLVGLLLYARGRGTPRPRKARLTSRT